MKRYINVADNVVFLDSTRQVQIDCGQLRNLGIVFVGEDSGGFWSESDPFKGRDRDTPVSEIESIFSQAEIKYNEENKPLTPQQIRVNELKVLLAKTDYKVLPDYDKTDEQIKVQRQAWRNEIRQLENS